MNIIEKLNYLSELRAKSDAIRLHYEDLYRSIIPADVQEKLDEIRVESDTVLASIAVTIELAEQEIKADILEIGATVKGQNLMAVYNKGRETWDGKLLTGYAVAHPEILTARKIGEPSVTIRSNGK